MDKPDPILGRLALATELQRAVDALARAEALAAETLPAAVRAIRNARAAADYAQRMFLQIPADGAASDQDQQTHAPGGPIPAGAILIEQPEIQPDGHWFFQRFISHSGATVGARLTKADVADALRKQHGSGRLIKPDGRWYWLRVPT